MGRSIVAGPGRSLVGGTCFESSACFDGHRVDERHGAAPREGSFITAVAEVSSASVRAPRLGPVARFEDVGMRALLAAFKLPMAGGLVEQTPSMADLADREARFAVGAGRR